MGISDLSVAVAGLSAALPPAILPTTPSGVLVLGDFVFRDYEIPEKITWGDQQKTHLFSYPGGLRSVEALGPEPMPITWAGRFQGAAATGRVRRLDTVCRLGKPLPLTWGALSFLVLVTKFTVNQERNWQCLYTIECLVVAAPIGLPSGLSLTDAAGAVVGDAAAAVGLGGLINNAGLTSALSAVQ